MDAALPQRTQVGWLTNPWAPKSIYDDADEPVVARARRWHGVLYASFFLLGLPAGYIAFDIGGGFIGERDMWLLACGVFMVVVGGLFGELANALWLLMCRHSLRLSAAEAAAALRSPSIPSFVLARLYERLYERES